MQIILVEKYLYGREILARLLKSDGYAVSIAKSAKHAITLLKETHGSIVLMNVFHCMYSAEVEPKLTIRRIEIPEPALFVTCGSCNDGLEELEFAVQPCSDIALDIPSTAATDSDMNRILQLCSALRLSKHLSQSEDDFNWPYFTLLMQLPTNAYMDATLPKTCG
ncbi:MAG: hypothetical protein Q7U91_15675 [Sideroxyarcus sp.]|nr:hypothetical protein [Sideroxyarcus sp.]